MMDTNLPALVTVGRIVRRCLFIATQHGFHHFASGIGGTTDNGTGNSAWAGTDAASHGAGHRSTNRAGSDCTAQLCIAEIPSCRDKVHFIKCKLSHNDFLILLVFGFCSFPIPE
ncbi:hypothetical protein MOW40_005053, partial [Serratia marcescens]